MQHAISEKSGRTAHPTVIPLLVATLLAPGCASDEPAAATVAQKPLTGTALKVSCPDARLAAVLRPMARSWAARTGAALEIADTPMTSGDTTDVAVFPFAELGAWADRGELATVPPALKEAGNPFQWSGLLPMYRSEPYAGWGALLYGLPLAADGFVLIYRMDRFADKAAGDEFRMKFGRPLVPPATWEDYADTAAFFAARDKAPSLPPLPADGAKLADLFFRVAAGFDRAARREGTKGADPAKGDALAFAFRPEDGKPRLDRPGFAAAGRWLADLKARGAVPPPGPADPAALLRDGKVVMAVLSLKEAADLRPAGAAVDSRLGVAPVPGTRGYATADGKVVPVPANYVPYFGGGWVGVVRTRAANPAAGFDLLADLAGPARSAEVVAAGGYGATRSAHFDRDRLVAWLGYGFDADRSKALQDAAESYVATPVQNPAFGLRTPDHAKLTTALAGELRRIAAGETPPAEALGRAAAVWEAESPADRERERRRRAVGLQ